MRFLGNIEAKADAKGRVFLPAVFRKVMQGTGGEVMVLRKDVFQQCLVLYPEREWNRQMDILRSRLNRWDSRHQQIFRQFVAEAEVVTLDGNGRFLISKRCFDAAGLGPEVRFIGMGDTIEIWAAQPAREAFMPAEEFGRALQELMQQGDEPPAF